MKIFAIIDDYTDKEIGYFFCYEKFNQCYIEFTGDIDEWDLPIFLEHFVRNGKRIVPPNWTKKRIQTRIIPSDRQNLGSILKENGLDSYDEIKLFLLADGRCAQDECYIRKISENELPQDIIERRKKRIKTAVYNGNGSYLITFKEKRNQYQLPVPLNSFLSENQLCRRHTSLLQIPFVYLLSVYKHSI